MLHYTFLVLHYIVLIRHSHFNQMWPGFFPLGRQVFQTKIDQMLGLEESGRREVVGTGYFAAGCPPHPGAAEIPRTTRDWVR